MLHEMGYTWGEGRIEDLTPDRIRVLFEGLRVRNERERLEYERQAEATGAGATGRRAPEVAREKANHKHSIRQRLRRGDGGGVGAV